MAQYPRSTLKKNCLLLGYGARSMKRLKFELPKLLNSGSKLQYLVSMNRLRAWNEKRMSRARARSVQRFGAWNETFTSRSLRYEPGSMYGEMLPPEKLP